MNAKPKRAETAAEASNRRAIEAVKAKYLFKVGGVANTFERGSKTLWVLPKADAIILNSDELPDRSAELWAYVTMTGRGVHGAVYTFHEYTKSSPDRHGPEICLTPGDRTPFQVWTDKKYLRNLTSPDGHSYAGFRGRERAQADGKYQTLDERIIDAACRLIAAGRLLSPAERIRKNDVIRRSLRESELHRDAERRAKWTAKAREVIGKASTESDGFQALEDRIIAALEWAQTQ